MDVKILKGMLLSLATGDALGVPVEFESRRRLTADPVKDMRAFGTWNQPAGTWSDDTSLTIAAMESIARLGKIDYEDIMDFTDEVIRQYPIDEKRVAVTGGSYGGFMTNW
ncbi:MAG: ADP-ribosylglycohydrolase family protein, partial [Selenomonadaceae bacterium]|nr:ADP-ribosylglycohydrolase family protein [Selenomonadaceae bacterium]